MKYLFSTLAAAGLVAGHGYVTNATIGGIDYEFYQPYTDPYTSPTPERVSRPIQGNGPVQDVTYADLQCGGDTADGIVGSSPAALHAPATAGSDVTLFWTLWPTSHYGGLTTYMAKCPDTGCQDYMPNTTEVWFKIAESGMISYNGGGGDDDWAVDPLMVEGNAGYTYTIPSCLEDGFYLVRHEILAVFVAGTYPGIQIYPGCHQLNVTGGTAASTPSDLVAFPGAYASTDAGITWDSSSTTYPIPGPTVFSCSGDSSSSGSSGAASSAVAASTVAPATSSSVAATSVASSATTLSTAVVATEPASSSSVVAAASSAAASSVAPVEASSTESSTAAAATATTPAKTCSKKRGLHRNRRSSA